MGRRGRDAHVDFLGGRWHCQFFFGEGSKTVQTIRKGLGFCVAMIFVSAAFDEEQDPGDDCHDADGDRSGNCGSGNLTNGFMENHRRLCSTTSEMWMMY